MSIFSNNVSNYWKCFFISLFFFVLFCFCFCFCFVLFCFSFLRFLIKGIDDCHSLPCQNNGTCEDRFRSFVCLCQNGFHGDRCEHRSQNCQANTCTNGGSCHDHENSFFCTCRPGHTGRCSPAIRYRPSLQIRRVCIVLTINVGGHYFIFWFKFTNNDNSACVTLWICQTW